MDQRLQICFFSKKKKKRASLDDILGQVLHKTGSEIEICVREINGKARGARLGRGRSRTAGPSPLQGVQELRWAFRVSWRRQGSQTSVLLHLSVIRCRLPLGSRHNCEQGRFRNCSLWQRAMPREGSSCESSVANTAPGNEYFNPERRIWASEDLGWSPNCHLMATWLYGSHFPSVGHYFLICKWESYTRSYSGSPPILRALGF